MASTEHLGVGWHDVAAAYAQTFAPLCAGVHEAVMGAATRGRPASSRRVLDVGAGTGLLAQRVAAAGHAITMIDPDRAMLEHARRAVPAGIAMQAALPSLPLADAAFDAVLAAFVVNHLPDPRAGVAELARVAAPGAPVVVTIWPSAPSAQSQMWARVLDEGGAVAPPGIRLAPELDFPRTATGLTDVMAGHLDDVQATVVRWRHRAVVSSLWDGAAAGVGGIGATIQAQSPATRDRLREAYDRHVLDLVVDGRLDYETEAVLGVGRGRAGVSSEDGDRGPNQHLSGSEGLREHWYPAQM